MGTGLLADVFAVVCGVGCSVAGSVGRGAGVFQSEQGFLHDIAADDGFDVCPVLADAFVRGAHIAVPEGAELEMVDGFPDVAACVSDYWHG
jgi:hypothetical protein